jgi:probable sporulation protein (polysaccharide deacetylase family)
LKRTMSGRLASMLVCLSAVWLAGTYGPLAPYVKSVKVPVAAVPVTAEVSLKEWILAEADKRRIEPSNAVIDRVWKAIPGYNGVEVDKEATYAKARTLGLLPGSTDFPWVYKEIPPAVGLDKLPLQPIYRGNPAKPMAGLMINVAWGDEYLPKILETLDAKNVKATFFLDGSWLAKHADTAKDILSRGHELSNHAYSHPDMSRLDEARQKREIGRTESLLTRLGVRNVWFAPPSGDYDGRTVEAAGSYGLRTVLWTLDTVDWRLPPPQTIVSKVARRIGPGQLILMHPTASTRDALPGIIDAIRASGLRPGTVAETLSPARVEGPGGFRPGRLGNGGLL